MEEEKIVETGRASLFSIILPCQIKKGRTKKKKERKKDNEKKHRSPEELIYNAFQKTNILGRDRVLFQTFRGENRKP